MNADNFLSTPEDLVAAALVYGQYLKDQGYTVKIEPYEITLPSTPVFSAKRNQTSLFMDIMLRINFKRLEQWSRYAISCKKDTRIVLGLPSEAKVTATHMVQLRALGIGVWQIVNGVAQELIIAKDLALQLQPPVLPQKLREPLGRAYELIGLGYWEEGFEAACIVLEQQARIYLKKQMSTRGIKVTKSVKKGTIYSAKEIGKMPIGTLVAAFANIDIQNARDMRVLQALEHINKDRITVVHYRDMDARRQAQLRTNVGKNLFAIVGGLKEIYNIKR